MAGADKLRYWLHGNRQPVESGERMESVKPKVESVRLRVGRRGILASVCTSPPHVRSEHDLVSLATETQPHDPLVFAPHMRGTCTLVSAPKTDCRGFTRVPVEFHK